MTTKRWTGIACAALMTACFASEDDAGFAGNGGGRFSEGAASAPGPEPGPGGQPQPGQLTAGMWDDNANWDAFEAYLGRTSTIAGAPGFSMQQRETARNAVATRSAKQRLDIALVLDTTGSMHDEIAYLLAEYDALAAAVEAEFPNAEPRWALIGYGDEGDAYVTQTHDFEASASQFRQTLARLPMTGGGDYPEAGHAGLAELVQLSWRSGSVAKVAFWVADAPHHTRNAAALARTVEDLSHRDVHLYPVAASGADPLTEHTMRSAAQLTGGRYIFVTDDSGIGDPHREPEITCYHVTLLTDVIERALAAELTGTLAPPAPDSIIRSVGAPDASGVCTAEDGTTTRAY